MESWSQPHIVPQEPEYQYPESFHGTEDARSSTSTADIDTPPSSGCHEPTIRFDLSYNELPQPGETFIIASKASEGFLAIDNGKLVVAYESSENRACHWYCVRTNGWFGFRNRVTGNFLGCNSRRDIVVQFGRHQGLERVHVLPCMDGGFKLLMPQGENLLELNWGELGLQIAKGEGGEIGLVWDFIRVMEKLDEWSKDFRN